ncbi:Permease [Acidisarcina polymorpha]|uniref:Permease n=1 Tax=Acidisarcina polymorpha TaxID=2211140 RepID=A0A2Z5G407_9BACT|nr:ABC transporter permease [Acidisarcina polymorpha]AXC13236.1 Permease [Acidisarcina polymorpha]
METFGQDIRYALRQLNRTRGFAVVAILTLALGIGANTAIFSIIDSVLLEPLPYPQQDRIVQLKADAASSNYPKGWIREYQRRSRALSSVSAYTSNAEYNVTAAGSAARAFGSAVSTNLFETLEVRPALGRFFSSSEASFGQDDVIVLSNGFWRQQFGADPNVIGHTILLDGVDRQIIGVAPPQVYFPNSETQFWIPIAFKVNDIDDAWAEFNYQAIGRLRDGTTANQAQAELRSLHRSMLTLFPWIMPDDWAANMTVTPLLNSVVGDIRPRLLLLSGAVGLVLLIACANVANLMLARAATRQREMALRSALGADAGRLIRQMLTESAVLAAFSGGLGVMFAAFGVSALKMVLPADTPRLANLALHGDVLLFAIAVSCCTGILSGMAPALQAQQTDLQGGLRTNASSVLGTAQRFRLSRLLVVGQIALAVVVLTAAGVMLRSLYRLANTDPGFRTEQTLTAQISLDRAACAKKNACSSFFQSLLERTQLLPGVESAALVDRLPLTGFDSWFVFDAEGHPRNPRQLAMQGSGRIVSSSYFELMGIHLLHGRLLDSGDASGSSRAVVINDAAARQLWPNQEALGKYLEHVADEPSPTVIDKNSALTVVGVVGGTHHASLDEDAGWEIYQPLTPRNQKPVMNILLRSRLGSADLAANLRNLVAQMNPTVPVTKVRTLQSVVTSSTANSRSLTMLLVAFGSLALLVGSIGVYSLISYTVSWRTREIGLRLAIGANRLQIVRLVLGQSVGLALAGSALGVAAASATTRLISRFLFETSPLDPLTYLLVPLLFCLVSLVAAWLPALRAAGVDPMVALRTE